VREFLSEQRSGWARRVSLAGEVPDRAAAAASDHAAVLDVRSALGALPPGQRATLVLRFYCDLSVGQAAEALGCSEGTVKSHTVEFLAIGTAVVPLPNAAGFQPPTPVLSLD
jgi:DNA-directed RNA polymerase specialized sigma24 family protein